MDNGVSPIRASAGALRARCRREGIDPARLGSDPLDAFRAWHAEWTATGPFDPAAMVLATVDPSGLPSARVMDLILVDRGFVFMSHGESRKSVALQAAPKAALCFAWLEAGRQVRVSGVIERLPDPEADAAFACLPHSIRLVAWATQQSSTIEQRSEMERSLAETRAGFMTAEVPRPPGWVGFRLLPLEIEFWQQRPDDLQDRICYRREAQGAWFVTRLAP